MGLATPMESPLIAFDTETATLAGAPHLLELGAVRFRDGDALDHFQSLVRPEVAIDPEATAIHGIAESDIRSAENAASVLEAFATWAGDDPLVAHNAKADAWVLGFELRRCALGAPTGVLLDSLPLARKAFPDLPDHQLATLVEELELDCGDLHRALPDASACWQVVEAAMERLFGGWDATSIEQLIAAAGVPANLASAGPARARRRPSVVRVLERAASEEASVKLIYGGPGQAPARISVRPHLVYQVRQKGYLEGECMSSGLLKTYRMDRIQRVETA